MEKSMQQREKRTKQTKTETTEIEEENEKGQEEAEAARTTWEIRQARKNAGKAALEEMGFNWGAESSSRGERIRKREQYQSSNETYEYPKENDSKNPKIQHIKEGTETEGRLTRCNKQN